MTAGPKTKLRDVTARTPCPVCDGTHKCRLGEDGLIICGRRAGEQFGFVCLGPTKDPQFTLYRREADPVLRERDEEYQRQQRANGFKGHPHANGHANGTAKPAVDWNARARQYASAMTDGARADLAAALRLPASCLAALPLLGFDQAAPREKDASGQWLCEPAYCIPEEDGAGNVVCIGRRFADGSKKVIAGGRRGLIVPEGWRDRDGPVYVPEGASDVLALTAMGLAAVGRPSNTGGVELLAGLLADLPAGRQAIVLGEMDPKPSGAWPGRDGAVRTAERLAAMLNRPVLWALPPAGAKDVRAWALARQPGPDSPDAWLALGREFAALVAKQTQEVRPQAAGDGEYTLGELLGNYPALRPPVIHGLLRQGETMNIIATSKTGKSWLVVDLALAVATGRPWLGTFPVEQGNVLVVDNELHGETLAHRIRAVAEARGIDLAPLQERITVKVLRGRLQDILSLRPYFLSKPKGHYRLAVLDALYRLLPEGVSENDNAGMGAVYNAIDSYANHLDACFANIHHASKGSQADKEVTDVGAGAGSQSRATDTHLVLRPHAEEGAFVLEGALRSWPPLQARCLRWSFPVWEPADELSPDLLRRPEDRRRQTAKVARGKEDDGALLAKLDELDPRREGCGVRQLRLALGWNHERASQAVARLAGAGILQAVELPYKTGKNTQATCAGVRRIRCE